MRLLRSLRSRKRQGLIVVSLLVGLVLIIGACAAPGQPAPQEAAPTEAPAEEVAAAPTEAPAEEPAPTEAPAEEPTAAPQEEPTAAPAEEPTFTGDPEAGAYIATITGGCGCHFNRDLGGMAGGRDFSGPFGVVYAANITSDVDTGIGGLSEDELVTILRTGAGPGGYQLHPIMPYMAFSVLSDKEALDLAAWMLSSDPIPNAVPARELNQDPAPFTPAKEPSAEPPTDPVARGEELVTIARCSGCHTPRNEDGSPNMDMFLAGAPLRDDYASNITPDEATGIGSWSVEEIASYLRTGMRPDGSEAQGAMAQQIDRRFSKLTEADAMAIAEFLKTIPAVENARPE